MFSKSIIVISIIIISIAFVSIVLTSYNNDSLLFANEKPVSEMWLLGPERTAEYYPYNITSNQDYTVYLGVKNRLNEDAEYSIRIKLCDNTQQLPHSATAEFSPLPSIEEFDFSLSDEETWETRFDFAINYDIDQNLTQIENIKINGVTFSINQNLILDSNQDSFNVILVFELWSKNGTVSTFEYTNQYLQLILKLDS